MLPLKFTTISLGTLLILMMATTTLKAQLAPTENLLNNRWLIKQDAMKGIGNHQAISYGSYIEFFDNHTWQSSDIIENSKNGFWYIDEQGILKMTIGNAENAKNIKTIVFNKNEMVLQIKSWWCVRTITCVADN